MNHSKSASYSQRLGVIRDNQFEAVTERFSLGRFLGAEPISQGLFGQNVYLNTSEGKFVLRGAPHWVRRLDEVAWRQQDQWQITKERYFAEALQEQTNAPVPWPMRYDASTDIFGWPYLVMPRMPSECFED